MKMSRDGRQKFQSVWRREFGRRSNCTPKSLKLFRDNVQTCPCRMTLARPLQWKNEKARVRNLLSSESGTAWNRRWNSRLKPRQQASCPNLCCRQGRRAREWIGERSRNQRQRRRKNAVWQAFGEESNANYVWQTKMKHDNLNLSRCLHKSMNGRWQEKTKEQRKRAKANWELSV